MLEFFNIPKRISKRNVGAAKTAPTFKNELNKEY